MEKRTWKKEKKKENGFFFNFISFLGESECARSNVRLLIDT